MGTLVAASRPPVRRRTAPAFTFVEILATLTLLSIVLPAVMTGISLSLGTASLARQQAEASALCQGKLMELVAGGQWQHADLTGDFGDEHPRFRWEAEVSDWEGTILRQLDVTVWWRQGSKDRGVTLTTLVYTGEAL